MPDIAVIKREEISTFTEAELDVVKRYLFEKFGGLGEENERKWRRFWWSANNRLEVGEILEIKTRMERSSPFHRRHFKIENAVFEAQDTFADFDNGFRDWLKIGAGHVEWMPNPYGGLPIPRAKSTSYTAMEDGEFREFHDRAMRFLRTDRAVSQLWPHLNYWRGLDMLDSILMEFRE